LAEGQARPKVTFRPEDLIVLIIGGGRAVTMKEVFRSTLASRRLDRCSDLELLHMVRSLPRDSEVRNSACELLLHRYRSLIWSCVQRYQGSPESREDLMQVG
jgi:hypothetical protein